MYSVKIAILIFYPLGEGSILLFIIPMLCHFTINIKSRECAKYEAVIITVAQKCHGNFNLLTAISTCSRQFQFVHGNFNLFTAISICSRRFQFAHANFNLFTAISICSRQLQFVHGNFNFLTATLTAFFASLTTCQLRRLTMATKSQNAKSKVDI